MSRIKVFSKVTFRDALLLSLIEDRRYTNQNVASVNTLTHDMRNPYIKVATMQRFRLRLLEEDTTRYCNHAKCIVTF